MLKAEVAFVSISGLSFLFLLPFQFYVSLCDSPSLPLVSEKVKTYLCFQAFLTTLLSHNAPYYLLNALNPALFSMLVILMLDLHHPSKKLYSLAFAYPISSHPLSLATFLAAATAQG